MDMTISVSTLAFDNILQLYCAVVNTVLNIFAVELQLCCMCPLNHPVNTGFI